MINKYFIVAAIIFLCPISSLGASSIPFQYVPINVVEVASFFCRYCYEVELNINPLRKLISSLGGKFDFIPIYYIDEVKWPSILYLSSNEAYQDKFKDILYEAIFTEGLSLQTASSICSRIAQDIPELLINECIANANPVKSSYRINKLIVLLSQIRQFHVNARLPIFIVEKGAKIIGVFSRPLDNNINTLLTNVINAIKNEVNSVR